MIYNFRYDRDDKKRFLSESNTTNNSLKVGVGAEKPISVFTITILSIELSLITS